MTDRLAETREEMEAFAAEKGIVALLDHLGLDGLGNEVNDLRTRLAACEQNIKHTAAVVGNEIEQTLAADERAVAAWRKRAEAAEARNHLIEQDNTRCEQEHKRLRAAALNLGRDHLRIERRLAKAEEALQTCTSFSALARAYFSNQGGK